MNEKLKFVLAVFVLPEKTNIYICKPDSIVLYLNARMAE